jgi:type 1 fimbriae regulatory protein FimB
MDERKHLTAREVARLLDAVKGARHEARDRCLVLLLLFRPSVGSRQGIA